MLDGLTRLANEAWPAQVCWRDPRFRDLLPRCDVTVRALCLKGDPGEQRNLWADLAGLEDRRELWVNANQLETRIARLAAEPLGTAVAGYVEAISGQHGRRLEVLLAYTGLGGRDPISGQEAAAMLGVTYQRISQIAVQTGRNRDRARPLAGIWMPQVDAAITDGWPDGYTTAAIQAIRMFFRR